MKDELYKKVYIKSESDLPKENGTYFVRIKTPPFTQELSAVGYIWAKNISKVNRFWLDKVDWYLQPIAQPKISAEEKPVNCEHLHMLCRTCHHPKTYGKYCKDDNNYPEYCPMKQSQRVEREVTDEMIEKHFNQSPDNPIHPDRYRAEGAKAMRDNKIK